MSAKKQHNYLYLLVGVILVGLIGVQLYWVKKTVEVEKHSLYKALKSDLDDLANEVEERAYCFTLQSKTFLGQGEGVYVAKYKLDGTPFENSGKILDTIKMYNLFNVRGDTQILNYSTIQFQELSSTLDMSFQYAFEGVMDKSAYMYNELTEENMEQVLDKTFDIDSALSASMIYDGVSEVLQKNNIDTTFSVVVHKANSAHNDLVVGNSDHENGMQIESSFFENVVNEPYLLVVDIPQPYNYIIQSISTMLISSIIIILILIITYAYFVKTIINQRKLSEMKNAFINNMTHEFRTPITNINLAVENWRSTKSKDEFYFNIIEEENKHLEKNVEQILELTTMKHHEQNGHFADVNIHEVIKKAADNFRMQLQNLGGQIVYSFKAKEPIVYAHAAELEHMMRNLIDNALKYNNKSPEIEISTEDVGGKVELKVVDNGIGMNRETQKMIFERFYRSSTGDRHDVKGFGLGLSYVKHIVENHRGDVSVKSQEGIGSSFIITLPIK